VKTMAAVLLLATATPGLALQDVRFTLDTMRVAVASRTAGSVAAATRTVEVLDRTAIERIPARTLHDLLARVTGADVLARSPASADLGLRGSSYEQVVVLVDGVSVSDDQTGHFDLDFAVPLEAVERIEILRGSGSALFGPDAIGGAINIVTAGGGARSRVRVEGGSFGTALIDADGGSHVGAAWLRAGGGWSRSDGHRTGTDYEARLARAALELPLATGRLQANLGYGARDFGAADFYGPFDSYEETRALTASLRWRPAQTGRLEIEPVLSLRRHRDHFILRRTDPAFYQNLHTNWRLGGEVVARWQATSSVDLAAGATADRMSLRSERLGDLDESRAAGFAEFVAGGDGNAALAAGLRADWHSAYGSFLSPSLAASWRASPWLRLRASVDRGFRAPTWTERFYEDPANIGDPDLGPERFWSAEIGAAVASAHRARLDVVAFMRRADRLIDWAKPAGSPDGTPWQTTNIEDATFRGVELMASLTRVLAADWTLRASSISFSDDVTDGIESKYALRPLTRTASIESAFDLLHGFALSTRLGHARRAASAASAETGDDKPYTLLDARLSWRRGRVTVFADATNLTDTQYLDVSMRPAPGQALQLGVRVAGDR